MHFSDKIKLQFGKEHYTLLCILKLSVKNLQTLLINYLQKRRGYPQFLRAIWQFETQLGDSGLASFE